MSIAVQWGALLSSVKTETPHWLLSLASCTAILHTSQCQQDIPMAPYPWWQRWHCHHPNSNGWASTSTPATCQPKTSTKRHSHTGAWPVLCKTTTMRMPPQLCINWHHANTLAAVCAASHLSSTIAWWLILLLQCNGFAGPVKNIETATSLSFSSPLSDPDSALAIDDTTGSTPIQPKIIKYNNDATLVNLVITATPALPITGTADFDLLLWTVLLEVDGWSVEGISTEG